jgi:type IV pilus assembly protein PilE
MKMSRFPRVRGFTLIELMVVVMVVAILAALAYPSYTSSVRKARRADAKAALTEIAQSMEALYARQGEYTDDLTDLGYGNPTWNRVPMGAATEEQYYQVRVRGETVACPVANCYRLRARPRAGTDQVNDDIEFYELWSDGRKRQREDGTWSDKW